MQVEKVGLTADAIAYLKTRSIYIATPCFGGQVFYTYTQSLMELTQLCGSIGMKCSASFIAGAALISQARNDMVHDFLNTDYTDLVFIDGDIGFEAPDVISLVLRDEQIIGVPYAKKAIAWPRVVGYVQQFGNIATEDLGKLASDHVFRALPDTPANFSLGDPLEVACVGTGLMRIKREVFGSIRDAFPDRAYVQDGDQSTRYDFFRNGLETDEQGTVRYCGEDYSFCSLARRAAFKIHLAPWVRTSHTGSHTFQADWQVLAKYSA